MNEILINRIVELKELIQKESAKIDKLLEQQSYFEAGTRPYYAASKSLSKVNKEKRSLESLLFINEALAGLHKKDILH